MHPSTSSHGLSRDLRVTRARPTSLFFTAWYRTFQSIFWYIALTFKIYFCSCSKELSRFDYLKVLCFGLTFVILCFVLFVSSLVVQFSRTIFAFVACFMRLIYYITSSSVCQEVFQKFFKFFSNRFDSLSPSLDATLILYHIFGRLSRGFWKFFEVFSNSLSCTVRRDLYIISYL